MKIGVFAINSTSSFEYFFIEILIYNNLILMHQSIPAVPIPPRALVGHSLTF